MWLLSCENRFSTKLQFGFFLNLVRCLLRRNLSRRNVWSRAGPSTHFNFRRNLYYVPRIHAILAATKDVHSTATGYKWLTFLLRLWCNVTKVRTSPGSTHFCSYCFNLQLFENEICKFFSLRRARVYQLHENFFLKSFHFPWFLSTQTTAEYLRK